MRLGMKLGVVDEGDRTVEVRAGRISESAWEEAIRG